VAEDRRFGLGILVSTNQLKVGIIRRAGDLDAVQEGWIKSLRCPFAIELFRVGSDVERNGNGLKTRK
jgi:hypothetical protein